VTTNTPDPLGTNSVASVFLFLSNGNSGVSSSNFLFLSSLASFGSKTSDFTESFSEAFSTFTETISALFSTFSEELFSSFTESSSVLISGCWITASSIVLEKQNIYKF
jgi:hypothetical protein